MATARLISLLVTNAMHVRWCKTSGFTSVGSMRADPAFPSTLTLSTGKEWSTLERKLGGIQASATPMRILFLWVTNGRNPLEMWTSKARKQTLQGEWKHSASLSHLKKSGNIAFAEAIPSAPVRTDYEQWSPGLKGRDQIFKAVWYEGLLLGTMVFHSLFSSVVNYQMLIHFLLFGNWISLSPYVRTY